MGPTLKEYRCNHCKKLLFKGLLVEGAIEVKCKSCHNMEVIESSALNEYVCGVFPCPHRTPIIEKKP